MLIKFYNVQDDNRVVHKSLGSEVHTINDAQVYNSVSIMNPQFLINYSAYVVNSNYLYVQAWNRYYYITDVTAMPGGRCVVHCREDVLMSNADSIDDLNAYVRRTESSKVNRLVVDSKIPSQANRHCKTLTFDLHPFNATDAEPIYFLTVVGGVNSAS